MDIKGNNKGLAGAVGLLAAGIVAGGVVASTLSASAADNTSTSTTAATTAAAAAPAAPGPGGAAAVRSDEKVLTGSDTTKARAAALAAVPGGTIIRVETDAGDAAYEAHMKKADGTLVTVKLDKNFKLIKVEDGMGLGDPRPANAPSQSQSGSA